MAKTKTSYFDMMVQKEGEDFLDRKTADELVRDAKRRIFKDMAYGNIDYEKHGRYFMEPRFLDQLLCVAEDEANNHQKYWQALVMLDSTCPGDLRTVTLCSKENRLATVYGIIYTHLKCVKDMGYNISVLPNMTSQIYQFAQDLANA